jgi:hypothetical protein
MAGLLGGMGTAGLLANAYNPNLEFQNRASGMLLGISDALLHPERGKGTFGDIGIAAAKGAAKANEMGTNYLQEAMSRQKWAEHNEAVAAEKAEKKRQDDAKADFIAANPQYREAIEMYPKEFGEFWQKHMLAKEGLGPDGKKGGDLGLQAQKVFNNETQEWEDWQLGSDGKAHKVEYGEGRAATGPGEGEIRGKKFKSFEENQNAVTTSLTNIAEVPNLVQGIRDMPDLELWGTGYAGKALSALPTTTAQAIRVRTEQLKSISLFTKIPELKGMGALSNIEGDTATKAMNRMDNATSYEEYMAALNDYEAVMGRVFERNQRMSQTGDWGEMDAIRRENNKALKFEKSQQRPPGVTIADWAELSREQRQRLIDAYNSEQGQ